MSGIKKTETIFDGATIKIKKVDFHKYKDTNFLKKKKHKRRNTSEIDFASKEPQIDLNKSLNKFLETTKTETQILNFIHDKNEPKKTEDFNEEMISDYLYSNGQEYETSRTNTVNIEEPTNNNLNNNSLNSNQETTQVSNLIADKVQAKEIIIYSNENKENINTTDNSLDVLDNKEESSINKIHASSESAQDNNNDQIEHTVIDELSSDNSVKNEEPSSSLNHINPEITQVNNNDHQENTILEQENSDTSIQNEEIKVEHNLRHDELPEISIQQIDIEKTNSPETPNYNSTEYLFQDESMCKVCYKVSIKKEDVTDPESPDNCDFKDEHPKMTKQVWKYFNFEIPKPIESYLSKFEWEYQECVYDSFSNEISLIQSIEYKNKKNLYEKMKNENLDPFNKNEVIYDSITDGNSLLESININKANKIITQRRLENLNPFNKNEVIYDSITDENALLDSIIYNNENNIISSNLEKINMIPSDLSTHNEVVIDSVTDEQSLINSLEKSSTTLVGHKPVETIVPLVSLDKLDNSNVVIDSLSTESSLNNVSRNLQEQDIKNDMVLSTMPEHSIVVLDSITNSSSFVNKAEENFKPIDQLEKSIETNNNDVSSTENINLIKENTELSEYIEEDNRKPIISVKSLSVEFNTKSGRIKAVDNVDIDLYESEILGLVGESGSGKTTIGRAIMGLQDYNSGSIDIYEQRIPNKTENISPAFNRWMARNIQMIFQDPYSSLNPVKKIKQILKEPLVNLDKKNDISKEKTKEKINMIYSFLYELITSLNSAVIKYEREKFVQIASLVKREVLFQVNKILLIRVKSLISAKDINSIQDLENLVKNNELLVSRKVLKSLMIKSKNKEYVDFGIFYQDYKNKKKLINQKIFDITKTDFQIKSIKKALRSAVSGRLELERLLENTSNYRKNTYKEVQELKKEIKILRNEKSVEKYKILKKNLIDIKESYIKSSNSKKPIGKLADYLNLMISDFISTYYKDVDILVSEVDHLIKINSTKNISEVIDNFDPLKIMSDWKQKILLTIERYDDKIASLLESVELNKTQMNVFASQLSGGQQQRVGIARALAMNPNVIIADEPISALDVSIQSGIVNMIKSISRSRGISFIFIAHDLRMVKYVSDRIAVMYRGRIVEQGKADEVYDNPVHPYTKKLIAAVPSINKINESLKSVSDYTNISIAKSEILRWYYINNDHKVLLSESQALSLNIKYIKIEESNYKGV